MALNLLTDLLLEKLADGEWHTWRELADIADRNLGREMVLAAIMSSLLREGRVVKHELMYAYRLVPEVL